MASTLAWPVRLVLDGTGGVTFATVAIDGDEEVRQNAQVILSSRPGERFAGPAEFGTPDPAGRRTYNEDEALAALQRWMPGQADEPAAADVAAAAVAAGRVAVDVAVERRS